MVPNYSKTIYDPDGSLEKKEDGSGRGNNAGAINAKAVTVIDPTFTKSIVLIPCKVEGERRSKFVQSGGGGGVRRGLIFSGKARESPSEVTEPTRSPPTPPYEPLDIERENLFGLEEAVGRAARRWQFKAAQLGLQGGFPEIIAGERRTVGGGDQV